MPVNMHSDFTVSVDGSPRVGTVLISSLAMVALTSHASMANDWPMHRGGPQLRGVAPGPTLVAPKLSWTQKVGSFVTGSVAIANGTAYVGTYDGNVVALDAESGEPRWEFITEGGIEATPCVVDDNVYIGSSDGFFYALTAHSGDLIWKVKTGDKILRRSQLGTGSKRRWKVDPFRELRRIAVLHRRGNGFRAVALRNRQLHQWHSRPHGTGQGGLRWL